METVNLRIEKCDQTGENCLKFTFGEKLTEADAEPAILQWKRIFKEKKNQNFKLVWDCTNMKQYEKGARKKWTSALFELKSQINSITLISDSALIRMGASVMGMATSLNIKAISSYSEMVS